MKKLFMIGLAATAMLASCSNDETMEMAQQKAIGFSNAFVNNGTRSIVDPSFTKGEFYQFNLSSCIRQQNSLTAQFVSFSLANLANIFYPPPIFTIINLCLL